MDKAPTQRAVSPRLLHITTVPQTLNFLSRQVVYMMAHGIEVHAASSPDATLNEFGERTGTQVHELTMERRITPLRDLGTLWRLRKILRRIRPQIVHGHTPKGGLLAMIGAWLFGVPVRVYHIHGLPMITATGVKRFLLRWSEKVSCRLATQVYCVSESVRSVVVAESLCPAWKIKVLLHGTIDGIDADHKFNPGLLASNTREDIRRQLNIPQDALVLGFVARIVRDKGAVELMQAWRALRSEFSQLHLIMVGPFEPHDPIPKDVEAEIRHDERIHLTGWLGHEKIPPYYRAMDLLVLPTYREGFNTVLLEAAAMELPVVASRVPGCTDGVVEGETGMLVPSHDATALAQALRTCLSNSDLRQRMGRTGRERVLRDFSPENMSEAIYLEYVKLLGKCGIVLPQRDEREIAAIA